MVTYQATFELFKSQILGQISGHHYTRRRLRDWEKLVNLSSPRLAWILTLLVSWVSIMKLCTCFSALVSSSFLLTTATSRAVQPAPWSEERWEYFTRDYYAEASGPITLTNPSSQQYRGVMVIVGGEKCKNTLETLLVMWGVSWGPGRRVFSLSDYLRLRHAKNNNYVQGRPHCFIM